MCSPHRLYLGLVPMLLWGVSGCGLIVHLHQATAEDILTKTFTTTAPPHVHVETFNGQIEISTVPENIVSIEVTRKAGASDEEEAREDLQNIEVTMTQDKDTIRIRARPKMELSTRSLSANITVRLPAGAGLELRTSNGRVRVVGPVNDIVAKSSNGKVEVKGARGTLQLSTSNGSIQSNGGVGRVELETSNGNIQADSERAVVNARTSNGGIRFRGKLPAGNHMFRTTNGNIQLTLPADAEFRLDARTSHGRVQSDFPLEQVAEQSKNYLAGTVGKGEKTSLHLESTMGSIDIKRSSGESRSD